MKYVIKNGAVSINGEKQTDNMKILTRTDALYNKYLIVRRGKKNYYLVSFN